MSDEPLYGATRVTPLQNLRFGLHLLANHIIFCATGKPCGDSFDKLRAVIDHMNVSHFLSLPRVALFSFYAAGGRKTRPEKAIDPAGVWI